MPSPPFRKEPAMSELKPCPFCGGKAKSFERGTYETIFHGVTCQKNDGCIAQLSTAMFANPEQAAKAWNTRTPDLTMLESPEMVELTARAICAGEYADWGKIDSGDADVYRNQAKAALSEIRTAMGGDDD